MSITRQQAFDLLCENYGGDGWQRDDPEWHEEMIEALMQYPSVKALRRADGDDHFGGVTWRVPSWWPQGPVRGGE